MVINTNLAAMTGAHRLAASYRSLTKSLARLSTGSRIIDPQDDAAGLAVSSRFTAQISRNSAAMNNLANAVSFSQTQDGYMQKVSYALDRMGELTVLAQDITKTDTDRSNYSVEFSQLQNYVSDIGTKSFNSVALFESTGNEVTIDSRAADCVNEVPHTDGVELSHILFIIDVSHRFNPVLCCFLHECGANFRADLGNRRAAIVPIESPGKKPIQRGVNPHLD